MDFNFKKLWHNLINKSSDKKNSSMYYVLTETLSFEIAEKDLPNKMTWGEALDYATNFGDRWRLPNDEELHAMFQLHQKAIGGFKNGIYCCKADVNQRVFCFTKGEYYNPNVFTLNSRNWNVRMVRNI